MVGPKDHGIDQIERIDLEDQVCFQYRKNKQTDTLCLRKSPSWKDEPNVGCGEVFDEQVCLEETGKQIHCASPPWDDSKCARRYKTSGDFE